MTEEQMTSFEDNIFFDLTLPIVNAKIEEAATNLLSRFPAFCKRRKDKSSLEILIANLAKCTKQGSEKYLSYHRSNGFYSGIRKNRTLNPYGIGQAGMLRCIDVLVSNGFLFERRGCHSRTGAVSRLSRIRPTQIFIDEVVKPFELYKITFDCRLRYKGIVVEDENGKPTSILNATEGFYGMLSRVNQYNDIYAQTLITVEDPRFGTVAPDNKYLYRKFKQCSLEKLGRFYGAWWQGKSQEDRGTITINGKPTVELDYAGNHIGLLYGMAGIPMPVSLRNDPYDVRDHYHRKAMKLSILRCLNTPSRAKALQSVNKERHEEGEADMPREIFDDLVGEFFFKHAPIQGLFFQPDLSLTLQYLDSVVADAVLSKLMLDQEIPVLPVHDSFIVKEEDKEKLVEAMRAAYIESSNPILRKGYTSFKDKKAGVCYSFDDDSSVFPVRAEEKGFSGLSV